jgi:CheY-like chemotaxis protein
VIKTKQCLLIDDDLDDQEIFLMALHEADKDVHCVVANDGIEALKKLGEDTSFIPDFIFLDINMPRMNGMQCLEKIKKLSHLANVKIIMFSTSADRKMISKSMELGATEFLLKPSAIGLLIDTLNKILES